MSERERIARADKAAQRRHELMEKKRRLQELRKAKEERRQRLAAPVRALRVQQRVERKSARVSPGHGP